MLLRVQNVAWMDTYHGREAGLIGETVEAVELDTGGHVAYVDDRDGEASELVSAYRAAAAVGPRGVRMADKVREELREHAAKRFLHGDVRGVREAAAA